MCGLIGVGSSEGKKGWSDRKNMMQLGLYFSAVRGMHSTGLAAIKEEKNTIITPEVYKKALSAADFLQMTRAQKLLNDADNYNYFIGHNRHSTIGNATDVNAHPFQFGKITLAHNGHVSNHFSLTKRNCPIPVDSASVCMAMDEEGEKETLEKCQGAFAFTWYNEEEKILNFARNDGRPLKFCFVKGENTMYWASERLMLVWLMDRLNIEIDGKFKDLGEGVWAKFQLNDLRKFEVESFDSRRREARPDRRITGGEQANRAGSKATPSDTTGRSEQSHNSIINLQEKILNRVRNKQTAILTDAVLEKRRKEYSKSSGRPSQKKRVDTVRNVLKKHGFTYEEIVQFKPRSWRPYKGGLTGQITGPMMNRAHTGCLQNVRVADWNELKEYDTVLCYVVNSRSGAGIDESGFVPILERHAMSKEYEMERREMRESVKNRGGLLPVVSSDITDPGYGVPLDTKGPGGQMVSRARFVDLVQHGCAWCSDLINCVDHDKILWTHDEPLCPKCSKDPDPLNFLNIPRNLLN